MSDKGNLAVALTLVHCPVCGENKPGDIIMNQKLIKKHADNVRDLDHKVVGIGLCEDCKIDGIYIIEVDAGRTTDKSNPYRTGRIVGITEESFKRIFDVPVPEKGMCYLDDSTFERLFGDHITDEES